MSRWIAVLGEVGRDHLQSLLGSQAVIDWTPTGAVAIENGGGEPAAIARSGDALSATIGNLARAGSFATVHADLRELVLECDPFGFEKPAYCQTGETVWAASDPRLLLGCRGERGWDAAGLHGFCSFSYVPSPRTAFASIRSLAAGERLRFSAAGRVSESSASWPELPRLELDPATAAAELGRRLRTAVVDRAGADKRVGVFLSGGLDSSLIAALLVEQGIEVELFTLDFGPPFDEEVTYARRVADHLGRPLRLVSARPADIAGALEPTAAALQQPFGDGVVVPLFLLGKAAAGQVEVIFNGEGGDQIFGGWSNKPMIAAEVFASEGYDRVKTYLGSYHRFAGIEHDYFSTEALRLIAGRTAAGDVAPALEDGDYSTLLHRLRAANLRLKGAQNIAPRAAQLAAAAGLRMRAPFFDRSLAEWSFGLDPELLLNGPCEKYLLKLVADPLLPENIVWREKRGMGVPTTEWCLGPLRQQVGRRLQGRRLRELGWFDEAAVARLLKGGDEPGEFRLRRLGEKLWLVLMLEVWRGSLGRDAGLERLFEAGPN